MEPVISSGGFELGMIEIVLGLALLVLGAALALLFSRRGNQALDQHIKLISEQQAALQGRLMQFSEDSASRDAMFRESLDSRLAQVSDKVGRSIVETQDRNAQNLKQLHERLALIDRAQKNIETLSGEVNSLQNLLSNKQARGAFGEKQMQDLIETYLPPNAYTFQATLSNGKRVDALIHLPGDQGDVAIDSKFPLESWRRIVEAESDRDMEMAQKQFAADVLSHIKAISEKYLIFGETHDIALMFLPSEAVYAELHARFPQVIDKGFAAKVMIVSPTPFMATLHTMRAVMKDAALADPGAGVEQQGVAHVLPRLRPLEEPAHAVHVAHHHLVPVVGSGGHVGGEQVDMAVVV